MMVDPDVRDWERLRKEIPAIESNAIDNAMVDYHVLCESENQVVDEEDPVNSPSHYTSDCVECIEAIESSMTSEAFKGYLKGNIQKYIWRYEMKGKPLQDLEKANWYLQRLIWVQENNNIDEALKGLKDGD